MSAGDRDTLAALLAKHRMKFDFRGDMLGCACGDDSTWTDTQHRAHVADVLLGSDWLAGVAAGEIYALEQAATEIADDLCGNDDTCNCEHHDAMRWLRARAKQLREDSQ